MALLSIDHLSISFGGLAAVYNLSMEIGQGALYGLIGPNGAGKTTVFNMLTGVYKPKEGLIHLDGRDITGLAPAQISAAGIARTFQNIRLFRALSVIDNVKVGLHESFPYGTLAGVLRLPSFRKQEQAIDDRAMEILEIFKLGEQRDLLAANLPYGAQRKLEIARALATKPKLLLLDEPAAGMNPGETQELMDTIRYIRDELGLTVLLIEHDMRLVSGICEELTVLNFGRMLAQGDTKQVLQDPEVIRAYLGE